MQTDAVTSILETAGKIPENLQSATVTPRILNAILKILTLILLIGAISSASGQEQRKVQLRDSAAVNVHFFDPDVLPIKLSLFPPPQIQAVPQMHPRLFYQSTALPSRQFAWDIKEKLDLTAPLKLQLADDEKNRTWRTILGSIQAGGTAYILYQHLKKYGLKQK